MIIGVFFSRHPMAGSLARDQGLPGSFLGNGSQPANRSQAIGEVTTKHTEHTKETSERSRFSQEVTEEAENFRQTREPARERAPGYPPKPLTLAKLRRGGYKPCSRNPLIAQTLATLDVMEQRGSGFARMHDAMLNHGLDAPVFGQQDGYFVVTLPGPAGNYDRLTVPAGAVLTVPVSVQARLTKRQQQMMAALARGEVLTSKKVQQRFKISPPVAHEDFKRLISEGLIEKVGAGRATRYGLRSVPKSLGNH